MMSEDYDHRWEPLAEVHFDVENDFSEENYIYCLCSRVFIRDGVKLYLSEKEAGSESEVEILRDTKTQEWDEHSHVHFSNDTYKKDESASCYCSASHTDNYCSTDEHDPAQQLNSVPNNLQPSDSGADLTYPESQSECNVLQDNVTTVFDPSLFSQSINEVDSIYSSKNLKLFEENYYSEESWDRFWSVNGERLIWASWIKKYSDYINPAFLSDNNELCMDDNNIPKEHSAEMLLKDTSPLDKLEEDSVRERKFSYDSKVNPYKKCSRNDTNAQKNSYRTLLQQECSTDDTWYSAPRRRSCSEHDRMLSPRTLTTTDSMTNVTKITLSSYDITSSRVTSESSPTDDYSVSSSSSVDQSNDRTRINNLDDNLEMPPEEIDTEQYWQFLWKKHFGDQYAFHYAKYVECHSSKSDLDTSENIELTVSSEMHTEKSIDAECDNSDGNSQEMPSVIEVQNQVTKMKLNEKSSKQRKRNKRTNKYTESVGVLLQNLLKEEQYKNDCRELADAGDEINKGGPTPDTATETVMDVMIVENSSPAIASPFKGNDEEDDPPEDRPVILKRSHETDGETSSEKIKSTFNEMGLSWHPDVVPKGQLVYRKRLARLRPPRSKRFGLAKKTYFDEDGRPHIVNQDSQDDRECLTDEDGPDVDEKSIVNVKSDDGTDKITENTSNETDKPTLTNPTVVTTATLMDTAEETANETVGSLSTNELGMSTNELGIFNTDLDSFFSDIPETAEVNNGEIVTNENADNVCSFDSVKRRRRKRRRSPVSDTIEIPPELSSDPRMKKYWKRRHSLFNRYDEGIMLDLESWFSVTPEKVARHLAERCRCDLIVDAFCGAGGNALQFAWACERVIAIDIDPVKVEMARHNATIYGLADRIEFIVGNFFQLAPTLKADVVFLSPPWGGPKYTENEHYDLETMLQPKPSSVLIEAAQSITNNIALYVPRNSRSEQLVDLAKYSGAVEIEQNFLGRRFIAVTAYYGDLVNY